MQRQRECSEFVLDDYERELDDDAGAGGLPSLYLFCRRVQCVLATITSRPRAHCMPSLA